MSALLPGSNVPMTREELRETVASTICCHTRMSPALQWEIDLLMGAIDKHINFLAKQAQGQTSPIEGDQMT
jgi:exoribonuclease II